MKNDFRQKLTAFFSGTWGMLIILVILFYSITFLVYYFYSPGPEERRTANDPGFMPPPATASQISSISIKNSLYQNSTEQTLTQSSQQ